MGRIFAPILNTREAATFTCPHPVENLQDQPVGYALWGIYYPDVCSNGPRQLEIHLLLLLLPVELSGSGSSLSLLFPVLLMPAVPNIVILSFNSELHKPKKNKCEMKLNILEKLSFISSLLLLSQMTTNLVAQKKSFIPLDFWGS